MVCQAFRWFTNTLTFMFREIAFYRFGNGRAPAAEFIADLPDDAEKKVLWVLRLIREVPRTPIQYLKKLSGTSGLWEVRVAFAGDSFRLLGFFDGPALLVLTSGFAKKSARVPAHQIAVAESRMRDYLRRKGADG